MRRDRALAALTAAALTLLAAGEAGASRSPAFRVHPRDPGTSARTLHELAAGEDTPKVWVFFTDKEIFDSETCAARLDEARDALGPRARRRRAKVLTPDLVDFRDIPVSAAYRDAVRDAGAVILRESRWLNAVSVRAPRAVLTDLAALDCVRRIVPVRGFRTFAPVPSSADGPVARHDTRGAFDYGPSFAQLDEIGVIDAHAAGWSGAGVVVALFDTGFKRDHPAFQHIVADGRILAQWDFVNDDAETMDGPGDPAGGQDHGSSVWSVCAGFTETELIGPAWGASFVLAKTEDVTSETPLEEDNWVAAAEWADSLGIDVLSSSLAYTDWYTVEDMDGDTAVITVAADIAVSRGIVVCTAAGNMGDSDWYIVTPPADGDSVIAVGAVDAANQVVGFSSHGPTADGRTKPEVVARGLAVVCACNFTHDPLGDEFATNNGTSLAAPLVAGCAALVLEAHPEWAPMTVREALLTTADNAAMPDNDRGWGRVDVMAAIEGAVGSPSSSAPVSNGLTARPNPFRGSTVLVASGRAGAGSITIHDVAGRLVWSAPVVPGATHVTWNGRDRGGRPVAPGVYVASLTHGAWRADTKVVRRN